MVTENQIEHVARAMFDHWGGVRYDWDTAYEGVRMYWKDRAKVAIEAYLSVSNANRDASQAL